MAATTAVKPLNKLGSRPATFDRLRKKEPIERVVQIPLNDSVIELVEEAQDRVTLATNDKERIQAQKALDAVLEEAAEFVMEMRFRSIGRKAYDDLLSEHAPTDTQKAKHKKDNPDEGDLVYNPDTFPIALVAASCVEPKMSEEEVAELWDDWSAAEVAQLFFTAFTCNTTRRTIDLKKGFGLTGN